MAVIAGGNKLGEEIAKALGLKHVRRLDFHMAYDSISTVTAEFYPEIDGVQQMVPILKRYRLEEIPEPEVGEKIMKCCDCGKTLTKEQEEHNESIAKATKTKKMDMCGNCWAEYCHHAETGE